MADDLARLRGVRSLVIDGELVACDDAGLPDFTRCTFTRTIAVFQTFDLLHHNEREQPCGYECQTRCTGVQS
jgi:hypothetical protein